MSAELRKLDDLNQELQDCKRLSEEVHSLRGTVVDFLSKWLRKSSMTDTFEFTENLMSFEQRIKTKRGNLDSLLKRMGNIDIPGDQTYSMAFYGETNGLEKKSIRFIHEPRKPENDALLEWRKANLINPDVQTRENPPLLVPVNEFSDIVREFEEEDVTFDSIYERSDSESILRQFVITVQSVFRTYVHLGLENGKYFIKYAHFKGCEESPRETSVHHVFQKLSVNITVVSEFYKEKHGKGWESIRSVVQWALWYKNLFNCHCVKCKKILVYDSDAAKCVPPLVRRGGEAYHTQCV